MSTRITPAEAGPILAKRLAEMEKSRFDFAVLQNGSMLDNGPSLQAWFAGDHARSIELMFSPEFLAGLRSFLPMTNKKTAAGATMIRVYLFDEERYEQETAVQNYLDWLKEVFRQVHMRWGSEQFHWLPKSVCDQVGIIVPQDDTMLFDNKHLVTSQYDENGSPLSRTLYELGTDDAEINEVRTLIEKITKLIADDSYRLSAITTPEVAYPWPDELFMPKVR